jgi:NAD(P)-dependent dehydrogenase (short-subunit alcohol dehydrogenase family)
MDIDNPALVAPWANPPGRGQRTALVTGGTDGIGKAIAHVLAGEGISVVLVGSSAGKGTAAVRELRESSGNDQIEFLRADLSLIGNVDALAAQVSQRWPRLHYLVLCAGIMRGEHSLTRDGIESNFAVNYLSRFALTGPLLPNLAADGHADDASRILVVSGAAENGTIHYEDVNLTGKFGILRAVSQFCEANDVFTLELARRLTAAVPSPFVTATVLKIGAVRTNIRSQFPTWMKLLVPLVIDPFLSQTPGEIAASARRLLLGPEFEGVSGKMFRHIKRFTELAPGRQTGDLEQGRRLWKLSEDLIHEARAVAMASSLSGFATANTE